MADDTTTVEVKYDTWEALDKRKKRGESFDNVIRRLIDNSAVSMGDLQVGDVPEVMYGELKKLADDADAQCVHHDVVTGEQCPNEAVYVQEWKQDHHDEWQRWHWCDDHVPEVEPESV